MNKSDVEFDPASRRDWVAALIFCTIAWIAGTCWEFADWAAAAWRETAFQ